MDLASIDILEKPLEYSISKWLSVECLISLKELRGLFTAIGPFYLFRNAGVVSLDEAILSFEGLEKEYAAYLDGLKHAEGPSISSLAMTKDVQSVYALKVRENGYLIKARYPVIQVKEHKFLLTHDGRYQSKGFGEGSVRFGFAFSFPQVFIDPDDRSIQNTLKGEKYANASLFKALEKWKRDYTRPTPIWNGLVKENATFRIGREFLKEMTCHRDLIRLGLHVGEEL